MIRAFADDQAEREALRNFIKAAVWLGGLFVGLPAFLLTIIEIVRVTQGKPL